MYILVIWAVIAAGRVTPIPMNVIVDHRIAYNKASEDVYEAMFYSIADTGVRIKQA